MTPSPNARTFPAPAKLNLDLRITGRQANGYHSLESIFCLIDLCDDITILPRQDGRILLHTPTDHLPPEDDLAHRAASLLKRHSQSPLGADIWLKKRIPTGGGLGGGSSDAATVLIALNHLWQTQISRPILMQLGLTLGADVPFFIFGQNAFAQGVGETLNPIEIPEQWYVIVKPPIHVATADVFSHQDLTRNSKPSIMPSFQSLQPFRNDMQAVVLKEYAAVATAFKMLQAYGKPRLTGSGACLFLEFDSQKDAEAAYKPVSLTHQAYCVRGLARHPLFDV